MNELILNFANMVNASLSLGDVVSYGVPVNGNINETTAFGTVVSIFNDRMSVRVSRLENAPVPPANAFILFEKDRTIEASGIIGYEATITMKNTSTRKAELFAVSTEVFESSK